MQYAPWLVIVAVASHVGCHKSLLDDSQVSFKRQPTAVADLGAPPEPTDSLVNDDTLAVLYEMPNSAIVEVTILDKELTSDDCAELEKIGTLVYLRCGGCSFPPNAISKIVSGNPKLRYLWLEECEFDLKPIDRIARHKSLQLVATHGSNMESSDKEHLRARGITVVTDSFYSIRHEPAS